MKNIEKCSKIAPLIDYFKEIKLDNSTAYTNIDKNTLINLQYYMPENETLRQLANTFSVFSDYSINRRIGKEGNWCLPHHVSNFDVGATIGRPRGTMLRIYRKPMRIRRFSLHGRSVIAPTFTIVVQRTSERQTEIYTA